MELIVNMAHFWSVEEIENVTERIEIIKKMNFLKQQFFGFLVLSALNVIPLVIFFYMGKSSFHFLAFYQPKWIPSTAFSTFQCIYIIQGLFFPIVGNDIFIMTLMTLVQYQFKILGIRIHQLFTKKQTGENFEYELKKCIVQHNFLLK